MFSFSVGIVVVIVVVLLWYFAMTHFVPFSRLLRVKDRHAVWCLQSCLGIVLLDVEFGIPGRRLAEL